MIDTYAYSKIMVVDDSPLDRMIVERMMQKYLFAESVLAIEDACIALEYLINHPDDLPELIFLDLDMPGMNGLGFLKEYAHLPTNIRRKSIVVLSASINESDINEVSKSPYVMKFISKPLSLDVLNTLNGR